MSEKIKKTENSVYSGSDKESVYYRLNKYGTYEIQSTADTDNEYPAIAQGLPENKKKIKENKKT